MYDVVVLLTLLRRLRHLSLVFASSNWLLLELFETEVLLVGCAMVVVRRVRRRHVRLVVDHLVR